ncbi:MAG TPA: signal recognition particle subunit SRP19/SEC65 family protein [Thermoplasmata archaeon]|nr:signal recognition particle subunit SRP19/SEC65 family protein [Thermoplasmata archaeon]
MPDHFFVYPAYLGKGLSRQDGRRLRADLALTDLTLEEIAAAAKKLGLKVEIEADRHYPRQAAQYAGRVKVTKRAGTSKAGFLRQLAGELARQRATAQKR